MRMGLDLIRPGRPGQRRRVDRELPAPPVRTGGGGAPRRATPGGDPRRRPRAPLDPRHLPALPGPRGEIRQPGAGHALRPAAEAEARRASAGGVLLPPGRAARSWSRPSWADSPRSPSGPGRWCVRWPATVRDSPSGSRAARPSRPARSSLRRRVRRSPPLSRGFCPTSPERSPRSPSPRRPPCCSAIRREDVAHPLDGYGMVVPRTEGLRTTALSFVSTKFAHRAPEGHVLLRGFLGGVRDGGVLDLGPTRRWWRRCSET